MLSLLRMLLGTTLHTVGLFSLLLLGYVLGNEIPSSSLPEATRTAYEAFCNLPGWVGPIFMIVALTLPFIGALLVKTEG